MNARKRKEALYGWVKWSLVLAMPFGVLLTDTSLNLRTWQVDYEVGKLKRELRSLQAEMEGVQSDEAQLQDLDRLTEKALELAMVEPGPQQFREVLGIPRPLQEPAPVAAPMPMQMPEMVVAEVQQPAEPLATVEAPDFLGREAVPLVDAVLTQAAPVTTAVSAAANELSDMLQRVRATRSDNIPAPEVGPVVQSLDFLVPLEPEMATAKATEAPEFLPAAPMMLPQAAPAARPVAQPLAVAEANAPAPAPVAPASPKLAPAAAAAPAAVQLPASARPSSPAEDPSMYLESL